MNRVHFSTGKDEWETPWELYRELDEEFGFTLDVCASAENAKCGRFYTKEENGLLYKWEGVCWCNPPYGRKIGSWVRKAAESGTTVVMLLPARTDTGWFHDYILGKAEIRFIRGRLRFSGATDNAPFPCMVVVFRGDEP